RRDQAGTLRGRRVRDPSVLQRAARPGVFPYTTLFRSLVAGATIAEIMPLDDAGVLEKLDRSIDGGDGNPRVDKRRAAIKLFHIRDRKSTRLNSSHVKMSYAVFCSKKKQQGEQQRDEGA